MSEDSLAVEAAHAYRAGIPKRRGRAAASGDGFTRHMLRMHILEMLGPIPADALAAFVALDLGDDALAYDRLAAVVAYVREAARSMNELRAASTKVEGQ